MELGGPIEIHDHDPRWADQYRRLELVLRTTLGARAHRIEHVGSTSVEGLAAKPVIDILVEHSGAGIDDVAIRAMELSGYRHLGDFGVPGRAFFRREGNDAGEAPAHVSMFRRGHPSIARDLRFRDHLREHPDDARRYATLKRALALQFRHDLDRYNAGKETFITSIAGPRPAPAAWEVLPGGDGPAGPGGVSLAA